MPEFTVTVSIDDKSIEEMTNYVLYGFKAVKTADSQTSPIVWFASTDYTTTTDISWHTEYQSYAAPYKQSGPVSSYSARDITLGKTMKIKNKKCLGEVSGDPDPSKPIKVMNGLDDTQFRTGIAQRPSLTNEFRPLCVSKIIADGTNAFMPVEKIMLIFATEAVDEGAVITQAFSAGLLIDVTGASERKVNFSTSNSWKWDAGAPWAKKITAQEDITKHLVVGPKLELLA